MQAADALAAEAASHGGLVPRGGVASRVQAAADKYSRLLEEERAGMQGTGQ